MVALSVATFFFGRIGHKKRQLKTAVQVARLDPTASSIQLPGQTIPSTRPSEGTAAHAEVVRVENSVVLSEVHTIPFITSLDAPTRKRLGRWEASKVILETLGALVVIALHAAGTYLVGSTDQKIVMGWQQWIWFGFWVYFLFLCGICLVGAQGSNSAEVQVKGAPSRRISLYAHKAVMFWCYFLITLFNLRSSLISSDSSSTVDHARILSLAQVVVSLVFIGIPTLFWPLEYSVPPSLLAIRTTMRQEKEEQDGTEEGDDAEQQKLPQSSNPPAPELAASFYSRLLFGFVTPELFKHYNRQYTPEQVPDLMPDDRAAAVVSSYRARDSGVKESSRKKDANKKRSSNNLTWRLLFHFKKPLTYQFVVAILQGVFSLSSPVGLQLILEFVAKRDAARRGSGVAAPPLHMAFLYAAAMLIGTSLAAIAASQALMTGRKICINLRAILTTEILTKSLRRRARGDSHSSKEADGEVGADGTEAEHKKKAQEEEGMATDGQIVNLISVDVFKVSEIAAYLHFIIPLSVLQTTISLFFLIRLLGWSAVVGTIALIVFIPAQTIVSKWFMALQQKWLKVADERLSLSGEVLACIRTVKCE